MKQISILIAIVLALAAVTFFLRDRGARQELNEAQKRVTTLSNEVMRAETIKAMHASTNTELRGDLAKHLEQLNGLSNRVAKMSEDLKQALRDHEGVRNDLQQASKRASDSELRVTELQTELQTARKTLEGREAEISRLTANVQRAETERAEFHQRAQKAEADVVRLQLDLNDKAVLRAQMKRLERQWPPQGFAELPKNSSATESKGAKQLSARIDSQAKGYYLQIQPDGSVKVVPPLEAAGGAR